MSNGEFTVPVFNGDPSQFERAKAVSPEQSVKAAEQYDKQRKYRAECSKIEAEAEEIRAKADLLRAQARLAHSQAKTNEQAAISNERIQELQKLQLDAQIADFKAKKEETAN